MINDREFSIGSMSFKLCKMDPFKQYHVARRLGPILASMLPLLGSFAPKLKQIQSLSDSEQFEQFSKIAQPLMEGLSKLSDEDANRVLFGLLSSVEIKQVSGNWARLASDSQLMFQDLELPVMLEAAGRAFSYNLAGFFAGRPPK